MHCTQKNQELICKRYVGTFVHLTKEYTHLLQGAKGIAVPKMPTFCQHAKHIRVSPFCQAKRKITVNMQYTTKFRSCLATDKRQQNRSMRYSPNKSAPKFCPAFDSAQLSIHQFHIDEIFCQDIGLYSFRLSLNF